MFGKSIKPAPQTYEPDLSNDARGKWGVKIGLRDYLYSQYSFEGKISPPCLRSVIISLVDPPRLALWDAYDADGGYVQQVEGN